jgi:voltage-gated potassium channel
MENISFKKKLYLILEGQEKAEENKETKVYALWGKRFDSFMLSLIFLNSVAVILETVDEIIKPASLFFEIFEDISLTIFILEYLARIWCITTDPKYKHFFLGRLKYAFKFTSLIDLVAFLPSLVPLIYHWDLRSLRTFRLIRLFRLLKLWRHSASLRLLVKIILNKKEDLQVIFFTIILLLIVSATLMYMIENKTQPEAFSSIPETMWWSVSTLTTVGYGDVYPHTVLGKILASFIALLGIGLFALPAGIISAGFMQEVDQNNRKFINERNSEKIQKAFETSQWHIGDVSTTHRVIDITTIKSRLELSEQDIYDAIKRLPGLRVRYKKNSKNERFSNTVVLEQFDFNRSYGSYINRQSNITIVSPMSYAEHAVGHFTAHLAKYMKADYLSNERYGENNDLNCDFAFSFTANDAYINDTIPHVPEAFLDFKRDLQTVTQSNETVFIIKSYQKTDTEDFNLHFGGNMGDKGFNIMYNTFKNASLLKEFYETLEQNFQTQEMDFSFTTHQYFDNTLPHTIHQYIWEYTEANVATIYINHDLIEWTDDKIYYQIIQLLGDTMLSFFGKKEAE